MVIHMSGYVSGKPITRFIGLKDGGVLADTIFKDDTRQMVVSESNEEVSIAKASNGMYIVLINTIAFQTAMLCNRYGIGSRACYAECLDYGSLRKFAIKEADELLIAVSIDKLEVESDILDELRVSISDAIISMDKSSNMSRFNLGDAVVDDIVSKYKYDRQ